MNLVGVYYNVARPEQGYELTQELMQTNSWAAHVALASAYIETTGELANGIRHGLQAFALEPEDQLGNSILASGMGWLGWAAESRRIADSTAYEASFSTGNYEQAVAFARTNLELDPENDELFFQLGAALARLGGHEEELLDLYEGLLKKTAPLPVLLEPLPSAALPMARLAWLRAQDGDTGGASEAIKAVEADLAERRKAGLDGNSTPVVTALLTALRQDEVATGKSLRAAIEKGWRDRGVFDEPMFAEMKETREFRAIREDLEKILAKEREAALQLIYHENPVPDAWQPLPETCAGV